MIEILLFFIAASLFLYVLLGGADYGAGILELLPNKKLREEQKELINYAMGPVWEANHMWLILVVVILFMGFPLIFTTLMTSLHIPMVALLFGIVIRGCAFTFRHYDAVQEEKSQTVYTWLFGVSSLWTSVWLGILVASLHRGLINMETVNFYEAYIQPWWGLFPLVTGLFIAAVFSFLASIYLVGETKHAELKKLFHRRAFHFNIIVVLSGAAVFATAWWENTDLLNDFISHPAALICMGLATGLFIVLWSVIKSRHTYRARFVSAGQVSLILAGWFFVYAPNALTTTLGPLSFFEAAAPPATLKQLMIALLVGSLFIFPALFYLLKVFKLNSHFK